MSLELLSPVRVEAVELVTVRLPLAVPFTTSLATRSHRDVLLVHVLAAEAEGWAECAVEPEPTYDAEFAAGAALVLRDHVLPLAWSGPIGDATALGDHLTRIRGHHGAGAALELAVLDAQLRAAERSLASWLGATTPAVPAGAALGMHDDIADLLSEADEAIAAGASRLRVKIAPGRAAGPLSTLRDHVGRDMPLQADANGSFQLADDAHLAELGQLDGVGLACLEQPLAPDDLLGHARLAERLETPICLDEPLTSLGAIEAAHALGACEVVCLKPARVGGWIPARIVHDRCVELGVPVWVGGMLETGMGRAANLALAALPGMTMAPDMDPRPRYGVVLAEWQRPGGHDGLVPVPDEPGTCPRPNPAALAGAERELHRRP